LNAFFPPNRNHQTVMSSNSSIIPDFVNDAENDVANVVEVEVEVPKKKGKGVPKKGKKVAFADEHAIPSFGTLIPNELPKEKIPESVAPETPAEVAETWKEEDDEDAVRKLAGQLGSWGNLLKKYKEMEAKLAEKPRKESLDEGGKKTYILDGKKVQSKPLFRGKNPNYDGDLQGKKIYGRVSLKELVFIGVLDQTTRYILADSGKILWNQKDGGSAIIEHLGETKKVFLFHDVE